jgi:DNA-binding CsgD family transcriptional regulator/tetratricopeptide (TPR) repeat protein
MAVLGEAFASPPALVLIEGEAGVGKSRLLAEFLDSRPEQGRVLVGGAPPFRQPYTLGPVVDAVRQATDGDGVGGLALTALAGAVRPLFPEWADDLPPAPEPLEDSLAVRHRLFRALTELISRLSVDVLAVEDSHWADDVTLEFLLYVTAQRPPPVSLVVTYRPEDVPSDSLLLRLRSHTAPGTTSLRLTLEPLDVQETASLVSSMLGGAPLSTSFAALLHEHTDGLPLAVEESVRLLHDRDDLILRGYGWVRRYLPEIVVPPSVRDAVLERAGRLGADAQQVLHTAAVLARPAAETLIAAVSGLSADRAEVGLAEALKCGLLRDDERSGLSFGHALAARAVYEAIPGPQRRALHSRAGRALADVSPQPFVQLARHFRDAGQIHEWCSYAERAADAALASGDEAASSDVLYEVITGAVLTGETTVRLMKKLRFGPFTGRERFDNLLRVLRSITERRQLGRAEQAQVRAQLGRMLMIVDEYEAGRIELEMAIPDLEHDPVEAAKAMILLGFPYAKARPVATHLHWLQHAATMTASLTPEDGLRLLIDRVTGLLALGQEIGWADAAQIPEDADTAQERQQIARAHLNIGEAAIQWGRYAEADQRLARATALAERHEYVRFHTSALVLRAHLDWFTGRWETLAQRVTRIADTDVKPASEMEALLITGLLRAAQGARREAEDCLEQVVADARRRGALEQAVEAAAALARLHLANRDIEAALRCSDEPMQIVSENGMWIWATDIAPARVQVLLAADRIEEAEHLVAHFAGELDQRSAPAPRAAVQLCQAILTEGQGHRAPAAIEFAAAARAWAALPRPYDALLARESQARCEIDTEQLDSGLAVLTQVWRELAELGATDAAERAARILHQHGAMPTPRWRGGRHGYGDQLSPRELDVVRLIVAGNTNREIAQALHRSPKTVANQLHSAMRKLGVTSRTALAVRAVDIAEWGGPSVKGAPGMTGE